MPKLIEYRVSGGLHFPMDMLRYDNSWPASTDDAEQISSQISGDTPIGHPIQVLLHGLKCTEDRWRSFGWSVTDKRKI